MSKYDAVNNLRLMEEWKRRTGNTTYKGIHKDSRTLRAEEIMRRKPYGGIYENLTGQDTK